MKKFLVVAAVLGVAGFFSYRYVFAKPEKRACARMVELCGLEDKDATECEQAFTEMRKMSGDDSVKAPSQCTMEAKSCGEAMGCMAGAYMKGGIHMWGDMMKGFGKALNEK